MVTKPTRASSYFVYFSSSLASPPASPLVALVTFYACITNSCFMLLFLKEDLSVDGVRNVRRGKNGALW